MGYGIQQKGTRVIKCGTYGIVYCGFVHNADCLCKKEKNRNYSGPANIKPDADFAGYLKKLGKSITSFNASATAMTKHNYWKWICICKYKNECMLVNNLRIKDLNINNVLLCLDN